MHDERALKFLIDVVGEDAIALGTDYPFPLGEDEPGKLIESLDIAPATKAKLLGGNALNWLKIPDTVC